MKYRYPSDEYMTIGLFLFFAGLFFTSVAGYITHIVWSIILLMSSTSPVWNQIVLAILGALFPPVGVIHGFIIWFS